jgi:beta-phosphoglucomutase-like phosphatase (HAD superfamily)
MLRAIVFDFDGVIADSEPLHFAAFRDILAEEGLTLSEAEYYARFLGLDDAGTFTSIDTSWTAAHIVDLIARKAMRLETLECDRSMLFPGADAAIRRAAAAVPIAIASGARNAEIRRVLDRSGLTPCFAAIVGADDTPRSKPAPDPYLLAIAQLRRATGEPLDAAECVAIEDSSWGLESARAAGLRTVGVAQTFDAAGLSAADLVFPAVAALDVAVLRRLVSE